MKNNFDIEDYKLIQDKENNNWLLMVIIFLLTIGIIIILCKLKFFVYEKQTLIKDNNQYYLIVNSKDIDNLINNKIIYINQKEYRYEITKISNDYSNIDNNIYQSIYINPYNYKTDSIITECYFLKSDKTIYELIIEFVRGGIGWKN